MTFLYKIFRGILLNGKTFQNLSMCPLAVPQALLMSGDHQLLLPHSCCMFKLRSLHKTAKPKSAFGMFTNVNWVLGFQGWMYIAGQMFT